tara:strand:- start:176 stop:589 length:414 start_codon:yes stop_codon:yes gene_type:complete
MFNCNENNYIEPIKKLIYINKFKLPNELIYILKDYTFYNKTKMKFIKEMSKKKELINFRIRLACSRKMYDVNRGWGIMDDYDRTEESENWIFGFPVYNWLNETTVLRGCNCKKCGEYEYICIQKRFDVPSNMKLCNC